jgi:predicted secreted protein
MSRKTKMQLLPILIVCLAALIVIAGCSKSPILTTSPTATPTEVPNSGPWPGVPVYKDSTSPIKARVNETFSIVLPPAPLFGWGWQDQDLSAFSLLESKTVSGPGNETNTFGPNAFLFKALREGTFQIILYVPSKPPQQTESFDIVVNP